MSKSSGTGKRSRSRKGRARAIQKRIARTDGQAGATLGRTRQTEGQTRGPEQIDPPGMDKAAQALDAGGEDNAGRATKNQAREVRTGALTTSPTAGGRTGGAARKPEWSAAKVSSAVGVRFDFMRYRWFSTILSAVLVTMTIASLALYGLNLGLDFTQGTLVEVSYTSPPDLAKVRESLFAAGFHDAVAQNFGAATDVLVRLPVRASGSSETVGDEVLRVLQAGVPDSVILRRAEFVGPTVGAELREQGGLALLVALGLVMIYIMLRFLFKFALGAVVALIHDVLIVLGVFSLFQWEFSLPVLAALLAVIGYSLNDTIVVSDRIRENFRLLRKGSPTEIINRSLNQTLTRTLITSLTTLIVLLSLGIFGGELLRGFAVTLILGVLVGTYSSIYVVANGLLLLHIQREDLLLPEKEGAQQENLLP